MDAEHHRPDVDPDLGLRSQQGRAGGQPLDLVEERGRHDVDPKIGVRLARGRLRGQPRDLGAERDRHDVDADGRLGFQAALKGNAAGSGIPRRGRARAEATAPQAPAAVRSDDPWMCADKLFAKDSEASPSMTVKKVDSPLYASLGVPLYEANGKLEGASRKAVFTIAGDQCRLVGGDADALIGSTSRPITRWRRPGRRSTRPWHRPERAAFPGASTRSNTPSRSFR